MTGDNCSGSNNAALAERIAPERPKRFCNLQAEVFPRSAGGMGQTALIPLNRLKSSRNCFEVNFSDPTVLA